MKKETKRHFYTHLVMTETVVLELENLDLTPDQKEELVDLMHSTVHHAVMDDILSVLDSENKKKFLAFMVHDNHDATWLFLTDTVKDVESRIKKTSTEVLDLLKKDIAEIRAKHS